MTDDLGRFLLTAAERYGRARDWSGTAAAKDNIHSTSLYETVGLDRTRWTILAVALARIRGSNLLDVYALDLSRWGIDSFEQLQELAAANNTLPVTQFSVSVDIDLGTFIDQHFQSFTAVLSHESSVASLGHRLEVTAEEELNPVAD